MDTGIVESVKTAPVRATAPSSAKGSAKVESKPSDPASDLVDLSDVALERAESSLKAEGPAELDRQLSVTDNNQVVMKVVDPKTKQVVRQIPPEELIRLREAIQKAADEVRITDEMV